MQENENFKSIPIWHSPQWITAIITLASSFLTIPDVISSYLSKQQEIELSEQKVKLYRIENEDKIQINKFKPLVTVIQSKPENKAMVLRFISTTAENEKIKQWAKEELNAFK